jgi:hypothetical protein
MGIKLSLWALHSETCVTSLAILSNPIVSLFPSQTGEIKALAGVDFLTISPSLLEELKGSPEPVPRKLDAQTGA